jgi:hypothetical protein
VSENKAWQEGQRLYSAAKFDHCFPALWLLAVALKLLAWLSVPLGLAIILSQKPSGIPVSDVPAPLILLTVFLSAVAGFLLWAASDFLKLLLCLEYNTDPNRDSR